MIATQQTLLLSFLRAILRPVAKFCLKSGFKIQDVTECLKEVFIEGAKAQLDTQGERITDSRLSVMTGLHRKDIPRVTEGAGRYVEPRGLIARVLGQWQNDPKYLSTAKKPRVLTVGSDKSEFYKLVESVSKELNPSTVLFELERVKAVKREKRGLRLVVDAYTPKGDIEAALKILANDSSDLHSAIEQNLFTLQPIPNLHLRTEYDRIRPEAVPNIKHYLLKEGHAMHERFRKFISRYDQDINPDPKSEGPYVRVVVGTFGKVDEKDEKEGV